MNLPAYTWDQAAMLGLATARGFQALGLNASTIRKWASRGHIHAVGKAPGGAHLYPIHEVTRHAAPDTASTPPAHVSHLDADGRPIPSGRSPFEFRKLSAPAASLPAGGQR